MLPRLLIKLFYLFFICGVYFFLAFSSNFLYLLRVFAGHLLYPCLALPLGFSHLLITFLDISGHLSVFLLSDALNLVICLLISLENFNFIFFHHFC